MYIYKSIIVRSTVHWQILTNIRQILTKIVNFYKNGHFSEKHVVFHSENLGCGRLGALICLQYASVCIRMHPYASICTRMHPYALFTLPNANIQHTLSPKKSKSQKHFEFYFSIMPSGAHNQSEFNANNKFWYKKHI